MSNCQQIEKNLIAYLDGKAMPAERSQVQAHLLECARCRRRVEEFRVLVGLLDELPEIAPSPAFDAVLRARIAAEPRRRAAWAWLAPSPGWAFAAAALVLISLSLFMVRPSRPAVVAAAQQSSEAEFAMIQNLPALEDYDVLSNFDALSELPVQPAAVKVQPRMQRSKI